VSTAEAGDSTREITSLLLQFRSPLAAVQLPRWINSNSRLQAASPAFEIDRLFSLMGAGTDVVIGFAYVLIAISALSVFIAIFNSLKERKYELAVMRTLGASRLKLFILILSEGSVLTFIGGLTGTLLGHAAVAIFVSVNAQGKMAGILPWEFTGGEALVLAGSLGIGIVSSLLPAVQAYRTPISETLAGQ
jgi:putative ABC transport system permease protein